MPIEIVEFVQLQSGAGQSEAFQSLDSDRRKWIIKPFLEETKESVFREWLAGWFARQLGLSWPKVELVCVTSEVQQEHKQAKVEEEQREVSWLGDIAVGLEWEDGLTPINALAGWPPPRYLMLADDEDIFDHIADLVGGEEEEAAFIEIEKLLSPYLTNADNLDQLIGFAVFTNWMWAHQDPKDDQLQIRPDKSFVFLDASMFICGSEIRTIIEERDKIERNTYSKFRHYKPEGYHRFTKAVLAPARGKRLQPDYEKWIERIGALQETSFDDALEKIPGEWLPAHGRSATRELLFGQKDNFVSGFARRLSLWSSELG